MTLTILAVAVALAAAVQLVTGFGFALVAAPVLVAVTDPATSVSVMAVLAVFVSAVTLGGGRERPQPLGRTATAMVLWSLPGMPLGLLLLDRLPADVLRAAVGVIVLVVLVQRSVWPRPRRAPAAWTLPAVSAGSGALSTSVGINGPPLVLVLTARGATARELRDTLAAVFLAEAVLTVLALLAAGELHLPSETVALPAAAVAGALAGHRVFDRMSEQARARGVTALLVASASTALVAAVA